MISRIRLFPARTAGRLEGKVLGGYVECGGAQVLTLDFLGRMITFLLPPSLSQAPGLNSVPYWYSRSGHKPQVPDSKLVVVHFTSLP